MAPLQHACREPIYDVHPLTGVNIELFTLTARWRHSAEATLVGFGGIDCVAVRQLVRLPGHSLPATPLFFTQCVRRDVQRWRRAQHRTTHNVNADTVRTRRSIERSGYRLSD
jgi:hypothetical protein